MGTPPRIDPSQKRRVRPKAVAARPTPQGRFPVADQRGVPAPEDSSAHDTTAASLNVPGGAILSAAMNGRTPTGSPFPSNVIKANPSNNTIQNVQ